MRIEVVTDRKKLTKQEEFVLRLSAKNAPQSATDAYAMIQMCFNKKEKYITSLKLFKETMLHENRGIVNVISEDGEHLRFVVIDTTRNQKEREIENDYPGAGKLPKNAVDVIIEKSYHNN